MNRLICNEIYILKWNFGILFLLLKILVWTFCGFAKPNRKVKIIREKVKRQENIVNKTRFLKEDDLDVRRAIDSCIES